MNTKKVLLAMSLVLAFSSKSFAQTEITALKAVEGVLAGGTVENIAVFNSTGWGAPSCPSAIYLAIDSNSPGFKNNYAAVLTARALGAEVRAFGACIAGTPFFRIDTLELR